jgi:putative membrane protein
MWNVNMMTWGGGWGGGALFGIGHLLWWGLIAAAIVLLGRALFGGLRTGGGGSEDRALAILKERYARGEIDKQEFEVRKRDLA